MKQNVGFPGGIYPGNFQSAQIQNGKAIDHNVFYDA